MEDNPLTEREIEVTKHAAAGLTNQEIARRLHITDGTVSTHLQRIYAKVRVGNRTELAMWALMAGHITLADIAAVLGKE